MNIFVASDIKIISIFFRSLCGCFGTKWYYLLFNYCRYINDKFEQNISKYFAWVFIQPLIFRYRLQTFCVHLFG